MIELVAKIAVSIFNGTEFKFKDIFSSRDLAKPPGKSDSTLYLETSFACLQAHLLASSACLAESCHMVSVSRRRSPEWSTREFVIMSRI